MGMCVVQDRWHSFIPSAPNLVFQIPTYNFDGQRSLLYEYKYDASSPFKALDSRMFDFTDYVVKIDGQPSGERDYVVSRASGGITFISHRRLDNSNTPLPPDGAKINLRAYDGNSSADRFFHLDLTQVLIQGAVPFDQSVLDAHHKFQGGSRLTHIALSTPTFGTMRYCEAKTGFDYQPPLGFEGVDSFSYYLETRFGQRSDAACITIEVGNVDIGD